MKPHAGRPRELTRPKRDELLNRIGQGATLAQAAKIVGVSLRTVQREAKTDDEFHHDLALAQDDAPVDPERQLNRAARAHWRAAAWMLERSDPDRYGKRPAKSCSHEKLRDMITYLIELALEAAPREHHQAIYRHMRPAADAACAMLLPDHQESQRWTRAWVTRPMLLSDNVRNTLFLHDLASPGQFGVYAPSPPASPSGGSEPPDSAECDDHTPRESDSDDQFDEGDHDYEAAMKAKARRDREEVKGIYADMERRRLGGVVCSFLRKKLAEINAKIAAAAAAETSETSESAHGEPATEGEATPTDISPPDGGIMSPKMHFGDNTPATECPATESAPPENALSENAAADDDQAGSPPQHEQHTFASLLDRFRARRERNGSDALKQAG
jgi:hypothetical protein